MRNGNRLSGSTPAPVFGVPMPHPVGEERESSPCGLSGDRGPSGLRPRLTQTTWWPAATAMMCASRALRSGAGRSARRNGREEAGLLVCCFRGWGNGLVRHIAIPRPRSSQAGLRAGQRPPAGFYAPTRRESSTSRFEKPHSLSYHAKTLTWSPATSVRGASKIAEWGSPTMSAETSGASE